MTIFDIPRERDLPLGRLELRKAHLVNELRRERAIGPGLGSLVAPQFRRVVAAVGALAAAAVAAVVLVTAINDNPPPAQPTAVVVAPEAPPAWHGTPVQLCTPMSLFNDCSGGLAPTGVTTQVRPVIVPAAQRVTTVTGGTVAQRRLVEQILRGMPGHLISRVTIAPASYRGQTGVMLRFAGASPDSLRLDWEQMLLAGAFRDLSAQRHFARVIGFPPPSPLTAARLTPRAVEKRLRAAAAEAGATVVTLRAYRPHGLAPLLVIRVDSDPAVFLKDKLPALLSSFGDRWRDYEGTFVEAVDADGAFIWAAGAAPRTSHGSVGTRAGLEGCSPVANWGPTPPPCPAP